MFELQSHKLSDGGLEGTSPQIHAGLSRRLIALLGVAGLAAGNTVVKVGLAVSGSGNHMVNCQPPALITAVDARITIPNQDILLAKGHLVLVDFANDLHQRHHSRHLKGSLGAIHHPARVFQDLDLVGENKIDRSLPINGTQIGEITI